MKEIIIDPRIVETLKLSENEIRVLDVLRKYSIARRVTHIAKDAGLPRTTVVYILKRFENRKLAERIVYGKRTTWKFKRGLEYMRYRFDRGL